MSSSSEKLNKLVKQIEFVKDAYLVVGMNSNATAGRLNRLFEMVKELDGPDVPAAPELQGDGNVPGQPASG